jgi:hypothetical protein
MLSLPKNPLASDKKFDACTHAVYKEGSCMRCGIVPKNEYLIQPLIFNGGYILVCPICALDLRNQIHGLPKGTPFQGPIAQEMYEEMLEELKGLAHDQR